MDFPDIPTNTVNMQRLAAWLDYARAVNTDALTSQIPHDQSQFIRGRISFIDDLLYRIRRDDGDKGVDNADQ